ncbi:S8 family serine peptidase [Microbulbifer sp. MLAF003]|uniref:S8 family peptidase n=1 Tax=unclassified Microbulbifer TaxID=2619833 RepID=UPI0024AD0FD9|nr:S8 family peptidase [Microbulbifer sp. MLAF003]WHI50895.1 S8 family serine peptidase [Microbulbifer sp. MLAF003]
MRSSIKALMQKTAIATAVSLACATPFAAHANETGLTDGIIIKYKKNSKIGHGAKLAQDTIDKASQRAGHKLRHKRRMASGAQVMRLEGRKSKAELKKIVERLKQDPNVEYAEPDLLMRPMATPNDPSYWNQWHYRESTGGLNLPSAWDVTQGEGAVVAVLDTGYRPHHDLVDNLLPGYDMISNTFVSVDGDGRDGDATDPGDWHTDNACQSDDPRNYESDSSWHGTHVAGTIAATTNNNMGVAGVAYKAKVVPVRVLGRCGGLTSDIADAIVWAAGGSVSGVPTNANPAQVLNLSLGGEGACGSAYQTAINTARSLGATVVVAAGNDDDYASRYTPASCDGVITVAATDRDGGRAYYSNYGNAVDMAAPGGAQSFANDSNGILSTDNSGTRSPGSDAYYYSQGTSMAAPHVAGVAALLYSVDPNLTPDEVESVLSNTTRSFPSSCTGCGAGIVDAAAAVASITGNGNTGNGTSLVETNVAGASGSWLTYQIEVEPGMSSLDIEIFNDNGEVDLYVSYGSSPTRGSVVNDTKNCVPYEWVGNTNGYNTESCSFNNPSAGTWYIALHGYEAFNGLTLTAEAKP